MGMGIGDWGLWIGDWAQAPIPNPQSPIPNPHSNFYIIDVSLNNKRYYKKQKIKKFFNIICSYIYNKENKITNIYNILIKPKKF